MTPRWTLATLETRLSLMRQFAVLSFVVIALITAALCLVIAHYLRKDLLEREWRTTADFIRTEALQSLTPVDFAAPASPIAQRRFRAFYEQAVMMPEIVRVKVYDTSMRVVWSDEPRLIGERFLNNPQLVEAIGGRTAVNLEIGEKKGENIYERDEQQLVEVYVPVVFPGDSRVVGVVETYKEPLQVFVNIRRGQLTVVTTALTGGAILYLSLFWIVRRAARRIESQHQALGQRSRDLVAANQELRTVQAQLLAAERMAAIGEVVAAVAHGIRNPLANIRASAQVATLDCDTCRFPLAPKSLANIIAEVDRLEGRLRELLQFVRPAERQSRPIDLNTVVRETLRTMAGRIAEAGITVHQRLARALPVTTGDPLLIEQVLANLISNGIEASREPGGTLTLTTGAGGDGEPHVFAEVGDTGSGIPPAEVARIFDLFYTTKAQGTGLGLAVAKKFTEAHGGTITVRSRPGQGAIFRVTLPAAASA